jgi:oligosaccharide repeat unit polymerase
MIMFIYLSTARSSLFTIVLIAFFFYAHLLKQNYKVIFLGICMLLFLVFGFGAIAQIVGKYTGDNTLSFFTYLFGPSHALDQIINGVRHGDPKAVFTFRPLHGVLEYFGLISKQPFLLPYYTNPTVNVYTMFGCYILDYGLIGSIIFVSVLGFLSGVLYGKLRSEMDNGTFVFLSSLNLTVLTLGVFYDYYTGAGYVWASILAASFFFPKNISRWSSSKQNPMKN